MRAGNDTFRFAENAENMVVEISLWHGNNGNGDRDFRRGKSSVYKLYLEYLPDELKKVFEGVLEDLAIQQIEQEDEDAMQVRIKNRMVLLSEKLEIH